MGSPERQQIAQWARSIKASDESAFERLFHHLHPRTVKFSCRYVHTNTSAQDVVQDSFINLCQKGTSIDPEQSLVSHLYQLVRKRPLNYLRDHQTGDLSLSDLPENRLRSDANILPAVLDGEQPG